MPCLSGISSSAPRQVHGPYKGTVIAEETHLNIDGKT